MKTTLQAHGSNSQQKVLWMSMFVPGANGRRGLPYVLVGKPGSAKTSICKQLATEAGLKFESVLGSLRSPVDFLGIPVPRKTKNTDGTEDVFMHYAPSGFAVRAANAGKALVMFDEVNTCPPSVQAALLRVLFEGVVGELELPPGVRMLLAMNATEDAAGGWDIAPPLANRMGWIDWEPPSNRDFAERLMNSSVEPSVVNTDDEELAVDERWDEAFAKASGLVAGFLERRPNLLLDVPKSGTKAKPWPSLRTWELATRALAGSYVYNLTGQERELACSAFVGASAYGEFFTWVKEADLPDPAALLDGKAKFTHNPARLDRTAAVLTSCTNLVIPNGAENRAKRVEKLWDIIGTMTDDATDVAIPSVTSLVKGKLMIGVNMAYKVLAKMEPVMGAANIHRA